MDSNHFKPHYPYMSLRKNVIFPRVSPWFSHRSPLGPYGSQGTAVALQLRSETRGAQGTQQLEGQGLQGKWLLVFIYIYIYHIIIYICKCIYIYVYIYIHINLWCTCWSYLIIMLVMWVKPWLAMVNIPPKKNGDDWGMVFDCFTYIWLIDQLMI